ncbi:flagellar brake protein [Coprothermobacter platensis]|uniref:flagellar brake protein n=1 Tax=Coprothermobacter platensis TaxID=108819 RepID=UPI00037E1FEE|nr:flagellar brake protein [Coprothermobacter platensis]
MKKDKRPAIGDRGILKAIDPNNKKVEYYSTRVEDISGDIIACSQPMHSQAYVKIWSPTVEFTYIKGNAIFSLSCEVIKQRVGNPPQILIRPVGDIKRSDRRQEVRVPWLIPASVLFADHLPADLEAYWKEHYPETIDATILDLSAGGCRLSVQESLKVNDRLLIRFCVSQPIERCFLVPSVVKRVEKDDENGLFVAGIQFMSITDNDKDKLFSCIFFKQRELIQKGSYEPEG